MNATTVLTDRLILKLATALGVTPARIRAIAKDEQGGAAAEYAILFAGLALAVAVLLEGTSYAVSTAWGLAEGNPQDTTAPTLCAGPVRPSPTGGSC